MDVLLYDTKKTVNYTVAVSHTVVFKHFIANSEIHTLPDDKIFLNSTPTENAPWMYNSYLQNNREYQSYFYSWSDCNSEIPEILQVNIRDFMKGVKVQLRKTMKFGETSW